MSINEIFFELIRVAIGTQDTLSRPPSKVEWAELYAMSKKQSLVGICFSAVQKLTQNQEPNSGYGFSVMDSGLKKSDQEPITPNQEPEITQYQEPRTKNLDEVQYLTWMGMAAKIQQRNEVVNRQCVELQKRLSADGLRSSILKGQGVGQLYTSTNSVQVQFDLRVLRQSGDIDVFVDCGMEKAIDYAASIEGQIEYDYINAHLHVYDDTEVELHWRLQALENLRLNKKLQKWTGEHVDDILGGSCVLPNGETLVVPSVEVNCFYILLHAYHHVMSEGLGLRQLMDYYFVLCDAQTKGFKGSKVSEFQVLVQQFGMMKFAKGVMWLLHEVFGLERECMICEPDEKEGRFLLNEVMTGGNFGHHDERMKKIGRGKMVSVMNEMQHSISIASHYPSAVFWRPIWIVYHFLWKRLKRI